MSPRVTVGLLAILVALGGYVYFGGGPSGGTAGQPSAKAKAPDQQLEILKLDDRDVQRMVVESAGQQTVVDKQADGNWVLLPSGEPADKLRISGILLRFASLRATRRFSDASSLTDFGLATPHTNVRLSTSDGTEVVILFGAKAPAEAGTYVKKPEDPTVFVVSNALAQDVEKLVNEPPVAPPTPTPLPDPTPAPQP